jgi:predicted DsbA family dithiol-disulfide isomerase
VSQIPILYFSDALCIWAHVAQLRVDAVQRAFGDTVRFEHRFCSVFGDTARKIPSLWGEAAGYEAFNAHLRHVVSPFPEITVHPEVWLKARPASSWSSHLFLKAVQLVEAEGGFASGTAANVTRSLRQAFFAEARDIAHWDVQRDVCDQAGLDISRIEARIRDGAAFAALASDYQEAETLRIQGSPSFVFNDGRQKLYGNVGFWIIEANIQELLREPAADQASWC